MLTFDTCLVLLQKKEITFLFFKPMSLFVIAPWPVPTNFDLRLGVGYIRVCVSRIVIIIH